MFDDLVMLCKAKPELIEQIRDKVYFLYKLSDDNSVMFDFDFDEVNAKKKLEKFASELEQIYSHKDFVEWNDVYMLSCQEIRYDLMERRTVVTYEWSEKTHKFEMMNDEIGLYR